MKIRTITLIIVIAFSFFNVNAQKDTIKIENIWDMSLEELMELEVNIATVKQRTIQASPSIVTLLTKEEIKNSGARNIIDVLNLIPGFNFALGSVGSISLGVRGLVAAEGKVLYMINGQVLNDPLYGNFTLENRLVPEQISRIEVIRGPGSAKYGGYAGLSVINIITESPENEGISVSYMHGAMSGQFNSLNNANLSFRKKINDFGISLSISGNQGDVTSISDFEDYDEQKRSMTDGSGFFGLNADLIVNYKNLETTFSYGKYKYDNISNLGMTGLGGNVILNRSFDNLLSSIKYDVKLNDKLTITPKFSYSYFIPYHLSAKEGDETVVPNGDVYKLNTSRIQGNLDALYNINDNINILAGFEGAYLTAQADTIFVPFAPQLGNVANSYFNGAGEINMNSIAAYTQIDFYNKIVNVTAGLRYDKHSIAGMAIVPRIALTKKINKFHAKLLYSQAYRLPDIVNITSAAQTDENGDIETGLNGVFLKGELSPENIYSYEFETGYQIAKVLSINVNVFRNKIDNPVIYRLTNGLDTYSNFGEIGTDGLETSIFFKNKTSYFKLNYSFYKVNENTIPQYKVDDKEDILLGFPSHKVSFYGSIKLFDKINVSPTIHYFSDRYTAYREDGATVFSKQIEPEVIANLFINYKFSNGFEIGMGVYDILDSEFSYASEIESYHAPLPTRNREFLISLKYNINWY